MPFYDEMSIYVKIKNKIEDISGLPTLNWSKTDLFIDTSSLINAPGTFSSDDFLNIQSNIFPDAAEHEPRWPDINHNTP